MFCPKTNPNGEVEACWLSEDEDEVEEVAVVGSPHNGTKDTLLAAIPSLPWQC